jgi:anti-sigma28 factor (negative regulator of flagellin synthesis)
MNIDKIGGIGPIYGTKKPNKVNNIDPVTTKQDKIEISEEARIQNLLNIIKETSKIEDPERAERIKDIKEKIKNGFYDNLDEEVLKKIADNLYESSQDILYSVSNNLPRK